MSGIASSFGLSRITSGANDVVHTPRTPINGRRVVIACHGYLGTARVFLDDPPSPNLGKFTRNLAALGFLIVSVDVGNTWGNATASARIEQARSFAATKGAASDKVVLLGVSMGHLTAMSYRRDFPTKVAGVVGIMPACDLNDLRNNNRASSQASIDTAWSVVSPAPLPASADPTSNVNVLQGIPWTAFYSTGDTVVLPATVTYFSDLMGGSTVISGSADHGDAIIPAVSLTAVANALSSLGA